MTDDWKLVFDHNMKINSTYFSKDEWDCNEVGRISILSKLENYRNSDNKFEFKLVYPEFDDSHNSIHWIQSSNPTETYDQVSDFKLIDVSYYSSEPKRDFQGLAQPINNWPKPRDKTMEAGSLCLLTGRRRPISEDERPISEDDAALHYDYMLGMIFKGWNNYTAALQTNGDNNVNWVQLYVKATKAEIVYNSIKNTKYKNLKDLKTLLNNCKESAKNIIGISISNNRETTVNIWDKLDEAHCIIENMEEAENIIKIIDDFLLIGEGAAENLTYKEDY